MTTEYEIRLDRDVCDGVFACLVRDERFVEAADGLATIDDAVDTDEVIAEYTDERIEEARQAAAACPLDAIEVMEDAHE